MCFAPDESSVRKKLVLNRLARQKGNKSISPEQREFGSPLLVHAFSSLSDNFRFLNLGTASRPHALCVGDCTRKNGNILH